MERRGFSGILAILFLIGVLQIIRERLLASLPERVFCNMGAALGVDWPSPVLILLGVCTLGFFAVQWRKGGSPVLPWVLVFAGGISNLWERIRFGCVSDYLAIGSFPVFNVADVFLTLGVAGLFWHWHRKRNHEV